MTEKENILKFYRHETPDHLPDLKYLNMLFSRFVFERPGASESLTDAFGVEYLYDRDLGRPSPVPGNTKVISDIRDWEKEVKFPDPDSYDWADIAEKDGLHLVDREKQVLSVMVPCGIYERIHALAGMEQTLVSFLTEPEAVSDLAAAIADYKLKLIKYVIEYYKPDIFRFQDDYGSQRAMQMSPDLWREIFKPHIARFVNLCHENGVLFEFHSCGFIEDIIPDFAELGVDSWQGMHINDVPKLKKLTNGKLLYHMSLDDQKYAARYNDKSLTEEELRRDIRETILSSAEGGCYFPILLNLPGAATWWGDDVIRDEMEKCRALVTY